MQYVYILKSLVNGMYYTGCTNDYRSRLIMHNQGKVRSTVKYKPWKLVHLEKYSTLNKARKRENQIKSWKKRRAIEKLIIDDTQLREQRGPIV